MIFFQGNPLCVSDHLGRSARFDMVDGAPGEFKQEKRPRVHASNVKSSQNCEAGKQGFEEAVVEGVVVRVSLWISTWKGEDLAKSRMELVGSPMSPKTSERNDKRIGGLMMGKTKIGTFGAKRGFSLVKVPPQTSNESPTLDATATRWTGT